MIILHGPFNMVTFTWNLLYLHYLHGHFYMSTFYMALFGVFSYGHLYMIILTCALIYRLGHLLRCLLTRRLNCLSQQFLANEELEI